MQIQNCSIETVANWIRSINGFCEIISVRAGLRYEEKGIIFTREEYYFTYCSIRYYDDNQAQGHHYILNFSCTGDGFFTPAKTIVARELAQHRPANGRVLLSMQRDSYIRGGTKVCGGVEILEIR